MSANGPGTHDDLEPLVRSIFFYNQHPHLQTTVGLHFFEPRYRILVQRALQEPRRRHSFVFLPNFEDYQASHGDIGYLATIIAHRYVPTANPDELPSADIKIHFDCRVLIHFQWVESDTGGLAECVCVPLEPRFSDPLNDFAPLPSNAQLSAWRDTDWPAELGGGARVLRASTHGHPGGPASCHWLLHAHGRAAAEAAAARLHEEQVTLGSRLANPNPNPYPDPNPNRNPNPNPNPDPTLTLTPNP